MISKCKRLNKQEWMILLIFILSIIMMITVVEWSQASDEYNKNMNLVEEEEPSDILTYDWTVNYK
ncbi:hypothetical protein [Salibacterium sp. K-3]